MPGLKKRSSIRLDVLAWGPIRRLLMWPVFPVALQLVSLAAVVALAVNGWGSGLRESADQLMTFRKTNLTSLFVWGLWWPGLILLTILLGRVWCTICPLELLNRIGDFVARRFGLPRANLGKWLRAGWMTFAIYLLLQVLVAGFSIHRVPHFTSWLLICLSALSFTSGMVFRQSRSFCSAFCPAAALLKNAFPAAGSGLVVMALLFTSLMAVWALA